VRQGLAHDPAIVGGPLFSKSFARQHRAKKFWLAEMRTPELLVEIAQQNTPLARRLISKRPLLAQAILGRADELAKLLSAEESAIREQDRTYRKPLFRELERLRHSRISNP